jgi:RHS repeat-associated protein
MARALNFSSSYYYYADYLGTSRASVDENGNKCYDADYFPWGNEQDVFVNTCTQNYKFNGKELDPDMGVYDFGARFFQDGIARFYQPDFNEYSSHPSPVPYARLNNPQSLNLYTYVLDNPLSLRDPDGHLFNGSGPGSGGCQQSGANPACGGPSETANPIPAQNKKDPPPAQPKKGFGVLPTATAAADIGVVKVGATAQGAAGAGAFVDSNGHPSVGAMATGSTEANAGQHVAGTPKQDKDSFAALAFAGVGAGVTVTNAGNVAALKSTTNTLNIDLGLGPAASISISSGPSGVWSVTVDIGIGLGMGVTETNSATATAPSQ